MDSEGGTGCEAESVIFSPQIADPDRLYRAMQGTQGILLNHKSDDALCST